jgi:hypothetical protein
MEIFLMETDAVIIAQLNWVLYVLGVLFHLNQPVLFKSAFNYQFIVSFVFLVKTQDL